MSCETADVDGRKFFRGRKVETTATKKIPCQPIPCCVEAALAGIDYGDDTPPRLLELFQDDHDQQFKKQP